MINQESADLDRIAAAICEEMPHGWEVKPKEEEYPCATLILPTQHYTLIVTKGWANRNNGKITIDGRFPNLRDGSPIPCASKPYNWTAPWMQISLSANKEPHQICADIQRRLLPDYQAQMEKVMAQKTEIEARWDRRNHHALKVNAILGQILKMPDRESDAPLIWNGSKTPYAEIKFQYGGSVKWEIDSECGAFDLALAQFISDYRASWTTDEPQS